MRNNKLTKEEFFKSMDVAKEHVKSADILFASGQYRDSISRSYYTFFDLVAALLAVKGLIPKSHGGALQLFGLHYIKTGIITVDAGKTMRRLMELRQKADYEWQTDFSMDEAKEALGEAKEFIKLIEKIIGNFFLTD